MGRPVHGIIFNQFRQYVLTTMGPDAWRELTRVARVPEENYALGEVYRDSELLLLVQTASQRNGRTLTGLLEDFGAFLAPALLRIYEPLLESRWRTLDILEHTEKAIHTVVRLRDQRATPPILVSRRVSGQQVDIVYQSPRRLCALAKGIIRGLGGHFHESVEIEEPNCLHRGDDHCLLRVRQRPTV